MDITNNIPIYSVQPVLQRKVETPQFTPAGTIITTLAIASAVSIGSNMVDVQNGSMTMPQALLNGVAKGTAATFILEATARSTVLQVAMTVGVLAGAGYLIDSAMKKNKQDLFLIKESPAK